MYCSRPPNTVFIIPAPTLATLAKNLGARVCVPLRRNGVPHRFLRCHGRQLPAAMPTATIHALGLGKFYSSWVRGGTFNKLSARRQFQMPVIVCRSNRFARFSSQQRGDGCGRGVVIEKAASPAAVVVDKEEFSSRLTVFEAGSVHVLRR